MTTEIRFLGIAEYMEAYKVFFRRPEGHALAECYMTGLMMDGERKSVEPMSERVNASERSMQRLLTIERPGKRLFFPAVLRCFRKAGQLSDWRPQDRNPHNPMANPRCGKHSAAES